VQDRALVVPPDSLDIILIEDPEGWSRGLRQEGIAQVSQVYEGSGTQGSQRAYGIQE
jgi:hypothetical protein